MKILNKNVIGLVASIILVGCAGSNNNSPNGPGVRVINGLSSVPSAIVTVGTQQIAAQLAYASVSGTPHTPYTIVPSSSQSLVLANANTPATPILSTSVQITLSQDIDLIAYNAGSPQFLTLYDALGVPITAQARFVNASAATGAVDFVLTPPAGGTGGTYSLAPGGVSPVQTGVVPSYQSYLVAGAYQLKLYPAGNDSGTPLLNETINLKTGVTYTFVLLDPDTAGGSPIVLQVQDNQLYDSAP